MRQMKNSNVEWIGTIPSDWTVCKFKDVASLYTGNSIKDNEKDNYCDPVGAKPYVSTKDINKEFSTVDYNNGLFVKNDDYSFRVAPAGSVLMCIEGGSAGVKKAMIKQDVTFVNKLCCFSGFDINNAYLYYFLQSPRYEDEFKKNIVGLIGGVSTEKLKNFNILIPPLEVQKCIANFLDEKCSEIDSLSADIQSQIDVLEEYKKSVITEAVTKGLNPDVEMKDSGIEWIGMIPSHWETKKGKFCFIQKSDRGNKESLTLLSPTQNYGVIPQALYEELSGFSAVKLNDKTDFNQLKTVHKGAFVISLRSFQGGFEYSEYEGVVSPAYQVFYPTMPIADFYYKLMNSSNVSLNTLNAFSNGFLVIF